MTPQNALIELLARVGAGQGAAVLVSEHELSQWPGVAVAAMKSQKLLAKARPASSTICPGCERECVMPVHTLPNKARRSESFIVCDKRSDINRVPISKDRLEQWQVTGESIADLLARLLGLHTANAANQPGRWELGLFKGAKHVSRLALIREGELKLALAGNFIPLADVLGVDEDRFTVDKRTLLRLVDQPVAGMDIESAEQRRERIKARVREEKAKGTKAFLKRVAEEEGVSSSRLKQLVKEPVALAKTWLDSPLQPKGAVSKAGKTQR